MRKQAVLYSVENDREITKETDSLFLLKVQRALLLALEEAGTLDETQCRLAEAILEQNREPS